MLTPLNTDIVLNEAHLHKALASEKIKDVMIFADENRNRSKMIRSASGQSIGKDGMVELFVNMLKCLQMGSGDNAQEVMQNIAAQSKITLNKSSTSDSSARSDIVKISSKQVRDSHFDLDISKDVVTHKNQKVFMVSCYMKDAYLGRYIIKRNYFYTMDREAAADDAYNEILKKAKSLKDRYHNDVIKVSAVTTQIKTILDGVISEIEISEDSLGTTVNRNPYENNSN